LKIDLPIHDEFEPIYNTDQIKKFIGKTVKKISSSLFDVISKEAGRLNIYTSELRGDSKAIRVFYGERLDFIDERIKKKEIILYLMSQNATGDHVNLMRSIDPLELDESQVPQYIQALLSDSALALVEGEIDELYSEVENVKERLQFIDIIDNEYLSYGGEEDA
jgi:dynactin complex subunit